MTERVLHLKVLTPDRTLFDGPILHVVLPGVDGLFGVYPRHAPIIAALRTGVVRAKEPQDGLYRLAIGEGFAEIGPDSVRLLVSVGEPEEEVDRDRADSAAGRARDRLRRRSDKSIDVARAEAALYRALSRLSASSALHCRCCTICTCSTTCRCPPEKKIPPGRRRGHGVKYLDDEFEG